jgi:hypothetical protein
MEFLKETRRLVRLFNFPDLRHARRPFWFKPGVRDVPQRIPPIWLKLSNA